MGKKWPKNEAKLGGVATAALIPCAVLLPLVAILPDVCRMISSIGLQDTGISPLPADFAFYSLQNLSGIGILGCLYREGRYRTVSPPLSLEKTIYIPFFKGLKTILILLCRILCDLPAVLLLLFKRTILRPIDSPHERRHRFLTRVGDAYDRLRGRDALTSADFLIDAYTTIQDTTGRILSNFSFALLMTCLGVCIILIFLLVK